ncbi:MAG: hypothetical protein NZM29_03630 [Nitrospira sp.]|nr:hypothetical protein [Nitrospira sp.]
MRTSPNFPSASWMFCRGRSCWAAVVVIVASLLNGCSPATRSQTKEERNLQALAVFFGRYVHQHKGVGPPNEAAFKKFIQSLPRMELESFQIDPDNIDEIFISPRDRQPYGIAWNLKGVMPGPEGAPIVIWEQTGVNGKRMVADAVGKIEEIDDATFQRRKPPTGSGK